MSRNLHTDRFLVRAEAADHLINGIIDLVRGGALAYRRWRLAQRTRQDLARLSDRALHDIGVARGEIDSIAFSLAAREIEEPEPKRSPVVRPAGNAALVGCG